ncbi:MAG: hypothetical protein KJZ93_32290 [Caldilineaceae bacterium]|nr:hypothetical protein [Caldilineaceae bacterium]
MTWYHWGLILLGLSGLGAVLVAYAACVVAGRADEKMEQDTGYRIQDAVTQPLSPIPFPDEWDDEDEDYVGVPVFDYGD